LWLLRLEEEFKFSDLPDQGRIAFADTFAQAREK
jgi:hypothetical protein